MVIVEQLLKMEKTTEKKFDRVCNRCKTVVEKSSIPGYPFQCNSCDEDLYEFETHLEPAFFISKR